MANLKLKNSLYKQDFKNKWILASKAVVSAKKIIKDARRVYFYLLNFKIVWLTAKEFNFTTLKQIY